MTPDALWRRYLATQPPDFTPTARFDGRVYEAEHWGSPGAMADELAGLIVAGVKTASCSCLWEWEVDGQPLNPVGFHSVVLDGSSPPAPVGIVRYTSIEVRPFNEVDEALAHAEGEGDRTLAYW
ncbi:MAG: ASCH domain-containing protein, partial [Planctomycetota bacterium]